MKGETETLLKFKGFAGWDWESEFQKAMNAYRPDANGEVVDRIRLGIVREFTDRVGEIIGPEFALKLLVEVDGLSPDGIIGHVDFEDGRQTTLARVLERVSWSRYRIPEACKAGPILDRLLVCTEIVWSPDCPDEELGELKRECAARFKRVGSISGYIETAYSNGSNDPYNRDTGARAGLAPR